jgi:trans-aconitate methyltransferase
VVGVDSSQAMLDAARALDADGRVEWVEGDLASFDLGSLGTVDVAVSNAALHWVPGHLDLICTWAGTLASPGWLAVQVPGNFDEPTHRLMREVAGAQPRGAELRAALRRAGSEPPAAYLEAFAAAGLSVDVWETTYLHVLDAAGVQENPVLEWVSGTALRPVLDLLTEPDSRPDTLTAASERTLTGESAVFLAAADGGSSVVHSRAVGRPRPAHVRRSGGGISQGLRNRAIGRRLRAIGPAPGPQVSARSSTPGACREAARTGSVGQGRHVMPPGIKAPPESEVINRSHAPFVIIL